MDLRTAIAIMTIMSIIAPATGLSFARPHHHFAICVMRPHIASVPAQSQLRFGESSVEDCDAEAIAASFSPGAAWIITGSTGAAVSSVAHVGSSAGSIIVPRAACVLECVIKY